MLGFLGGTGEEGKGLAFRLALAGESVMIGSRDEARAVGAAAEVNDLLENKLQLVLTICKQLRNQTLCS
ncbi:MAG: hypothetical protein CM1200mP15_19440 [Dehalococcoidia bacterium]|nr:MAG: hypothetical protein CM1200mP15_19440 [Dehalococcoidia bacterium]